MPRYCLDAFISCPLLSKQSEKVSMTLCLLIAFSKFDKLIEGFFDEGGVTINYFLKWE